MKKKDCVQCHREMEHSYGNGEWAAPFCSYPDCPNYYLLQCGVEEKRESANPKSDE